MEEGQREEERCQRDEERRERRQKRRERWQERDQREEREEEAEREEERDREEAQRRQVAMLLLLQDQQEEEAVSATMAWVTADREVTPELRAGAMNRKRLDWDDHAETSTAENSFRRKYRMDEPAFNKLVEILRPVIERDEKFARECDRSCVPRHNFFKKHGKIEYKHTSTYVYRFHALDG